MPLSRRIYRVRHDGSPMHYLTYRGRANVPRRLLLVRHTESAVTPGRNSCAAKMPHSLIGAARRPNRLQLKTLLRFHPTTAAGAFRKQADPRPHRLHPLPWAHALRQTKAALGDACSGYRTFKLHNGLQHVRTASARPRPAKNRRAACMPRPSTPICTNVCAWTPVPKADQTAAADCRAEDQRLVDERSSSVVADSAHDAPSIAPSANAKSDHCQRWTPHRIHGQSCMNISRQSRESLFY